jgi:hypothetical protein
MKDKEKELKKIATDFHKGMQDTGEITKRLSPIPENMRQEKLELE